MLRGLSLRTRLVLGVIVLAAAGLVAADAVTYASLRSFLLDRTDTALAQDAHAVEGAHFGRNGPGPRGFFVQLRTRDGSGVVQTLPDQPPPGREQSTPRLPDAISLAHASHEGPDVVRYFTVPSTGGDRYRVRASLEPNDESMLVVATSLLDVDG